MLTGEIAERIERELGDYGEDHTKRPQLRPDLLGIWTAWQQFGVPAQVEGGGMVSPILRDLRATLYPARAAWLDRHAESESERALHEQCWSALDDEQISYLAEVVKEASSKSK